MGIMNYDQRPTTNDQRLNAEQRRAVETTEGPLLVLSGAGTGKTSVLVARVVHILRSGLAQPWQMLALTFTNKAANEMRERVRASLSPYEQASLGDIWMGTFHSICLRILRRNAERARLRKDFLVFGEDDQKSVLKTVITALGLDVKDYPPGEWVEKISAAKDKGLKQYAIGGEKNLSANFDKIYAAYNAELSRLGAVDFGDLILKVLELFRDAPDILQKYQRQFRYIMVDEFQDTNAAQHQFLRRLAKHAVSETAATENICCVGDDDQSIYSWRGAEIRNILEFERDYPGAKVIRLETNYRSSANILCAANSLIRHNRGRLGKELRPAAAAGDGEKIHVLNLPTDFDEARTISDAIENLYHANQAKYRDFAVLIRAGSLSRNLEEEFAARGIPYRLIGATKFYDRAEIRDAVAYARLLVYPFDDLSFLRVLSKPRRGFGDSALLKLRDFAAHDTLPLLRAMREIPLSGKQKTAADEFVASFDFDWGASAPMDAVAKLLEDSGYLKMWRESKDPDAPDRLANIDELLAGVISKYDSLAEFLEHAALMMTEDDSEDKQSSDAVSIMTIHAAKGLEFDTVFLPAWEEGIFPNEMAVNDGGLEEERRLAYVALTRAKRRAVITCAMSRVQYGQREPHGPSKFISEIDPQFIESNFSKSEPRRPRVENTKQKFVSKISAGPRTTVGKLVRHPELGSGVVIEDGGDILTVAFRDRGIKKVAKQWLVVS